MTRERIIKALKDHPHWFTVTQGALCAIMIANIWFSWPQPFTLIVSSAATGFAISAIIYTRLASKYLFDSEQLRKESVEAFTEAMTAAMDAVQAEARRRGMEIDFVDADRATISVRDPGKLH